MRRDFKKSSMIPVYNDDTPMRPTFGLGLMGGGSWGAFTAGVLESIVPTLESIGQIKSISGTSAGAINGALLASGLNNGGAHLALRRIKKTWDEIKENGHFIQLASNVTDWFLPAEDRWPNLPTQFNMMSGIQMMNSCLPSSATRYLSELLKNNIPDWNDVQAGQVAFCANTLQRNSLTGERKHIILSGRELTPDGVTASAALKELGTHRIRDKGASHEMRYTYLDGGYVENPPTKPLLDSDVTDIIMIILHDHNEKQTKPQTGAKLYHEEIHTDVSALALADNRSKHIHAIEIEMAGGKINGWNLNNSSKLNTSPAFIDALYQAGKAAGKKWLQQNIESLGLQSSYHPHEDVVTDMMAMGHHF